jgi:hypothetical protein
MSYRLRVDDNFHYMDASERRDGGCFATLEAAVEAAKAVVDSYLHEAYKPGMTARELFESYTSFGEDPFIVSEEVSGVPFSAWDYARQRCEELCPGSGQGSEPRPQTDPDVERRRLTLMRRIADYAGRPADSCRDGTRLGELGDSLHQLMYVVAQLEAETERRLPWDQLMRIKTVGELVDLVLKTPKGR